MRTGFSLVCLLTTLGSAGPMSCQDYPFQEVRTATIREKVEIIWVPREKVDILFVVDNSKSMVGEQRAIAESFSRFTAELDENFGEGEYHIAVITTGLESEDCGPCPPDQPNYYSCINETGEGGRFQDLLGRNRGTVQEPEFQFASDPTCRIMDSSSVDSCFYDTHMEQGVIFVGVRGCGYERGLAPMRQALETPLLESWNHGFLRQEAQLVVVVISDEEDCGEVGDITERIQGISGNACYYAAKGIGPDGSLRDPQLGLPYELTSVQDYYDFLLGLKNGQASMVKFAAIVGVDDPFDPGATQITYESGDPNARINPICETPGCADACDPLSVNYVSCLDYCRARPGTRYLGLAEMFGIGQGENGFVDTICQPDFSETMVKLGEFVGCPKVFKLQENLLDKALANIFVNDVAVPRYSCSGSAKEKVEICEGLGDASCSAGDCVETWWFEPPGDDPTAPGGKFRFAEHYNPCELIDEGDIKIELVYVTS